MLLWEGMGGIQIMGGRGITGKSGYGGWNSQYLNYVVASREGLPPNIVME